MASSWRTDYRSNNQCLANRIGRLVRITRRARASLSRVASYGRTRINELWRCSACDAALSTAYGLCSAYATIDGSSMGTTNGVWLAANAADVWAVNAAAHGVLITNAAADVATNATNNLDATARLRTTLRPTSGLWPASSRLRLRLEMIRINHENNFI